MEPQKQNYPDMNNINNLAIGSTLRDVTELIGLPQRSVTSGLQSADYYMSNGKIVRIYFINDGQNGLIVSQIKIL